MIFNFLHFVVLVTWSSSKDEFVLCGVRVCVITTLWIICGSMLPLLLVGFPTIYRPERSIWQLWTLTIVVDLLSSSSFSGVVIYPHCTSFSGFPIAFLVDLREFVLMPHCFLFSRALVFRRAVACWEA